MPRTTEAKRKSPSTDAPTSKTAAIKAGARKSGTGKSKATKAVAVDAPVETAGGELATVILGWLDEAKAEQIVAMDIRGKTSIGDCMIVATGRTDRHVGAIADQLKTHLKDYGVANVRVEGTETCDWVLVDVGAILVNVFRPDVREYYNLEKMWSAERPSDEAAGEADAAH